MKKTVSFIISAVILFSIGSSAQAYNDVPENHKYRSAVEYVEAKKIFEGDNFRPNEAITREEFAMWIAKNIGFSADRYKPKTAERFADVSAVGKPFGPYIYKLLDIGVFELRDFPNALFKPKSKITKETALGWILSLEGVPVPKIFEDANFQAKDVKADSPLAPLINKAIEMGMINPGRIRPEGTVSRGLAAYFLKTVKSQQGNIVVTIVPPTQSDLTNHPKFEVFQEAWRRIHSGYLRRDSLSRDGMIYAAIEGMLKELGDKYTEFERPGDNAVLESLSGQIIGIGAVIQLKDEDLTIVSPLVGSPAEKAGLQPNDIVKQIDGVSVKGLTLQQAVSKIKGEQGTQVRLTIKRGSQMKEFLITRDIVKIVSTELKRTEDNIAQLTLANFGDNTSSEFAAAVEEILKDKPKGIVLDLRNNPGGYLNTAIELGGYFIKSGDPVAMVKYPNRSVPEKSAGAALLAEFKVVALINAGSASAAEILGGALQDYKLATIIGEKSYGKGTVQELSDFSDGSTLKLTVAEWLTPKGRSIEKNGIAPDIVVEFTEADRAAGRDPQMERALEELRK